MKRTAIRAGEAGLRRCDLDRHSTAVGAVWAGGERLYEILLRAFYDAGHCNTE